MALNLQNFASGDTDYIAKLNSNIAELTTAITALQTQVGAIGGGTQLSVGQLMGTLFNNADALIGPGSYAPTKGANTLTVAAGGMYLQSAQTVVAIMNSVPISFIGQPAGIHYIKVDGVGQPARFNTQTPGTIYSVYWSGSSFGEIVYIAPVFFDTTEASRSRRSAALGAVYSTLDDRLEVGEAKAVDAQSKSTQALSLVYELEASMTSQIRKVGVTVDSIGGVKGAIQIDFDGVIIGWSVIADTVGTLQVEVSVKPSAAPPAVPGIPNPITDKISASAPIQLTSAQSASRAESGVSTWYTSLAKWDVVQFSTVAVTGITRATMYLRIQEITPSPPVINPLEFNEGDRDGSVVYG